VSQWKCTRTIAYQEKNDAFWLQRKLGGEMMASVIKLNRDGRVGWRVRFYVDKRRRELYLAGASKKVADSVGRYVEELSTAKANNVPATPEAVAWANGTEGNLRDNLVAWGLAVPINPRMRKDEGRLLGAFTEAYIASRTDTKPRTRINYNQARRLLVEYFGAEKLLRSITPTDAERWKRWMLARPLAIATVSKHVKRAKTMFAEAVGDHLIAVSPFVYLKGGSESNPERQRFIDPTASEKVLNACPDADWRLIFTLARYGGLRCPSEVLGLRWSDIDWDAGKLRIESAKTGLRFCPMFPEIRLALYASWSLAADGAVYCITRYQALSVNLRTQFGRILERAGLVPWPKLFHNLRASRRTELQDLYPDHVINKWLGHSGAVAEKHYLQVTDEHWSKAIEVRPPARPPISADQEVPGEITPIKKPSVSLGSDGMGGIVMSPSMPPQGLEPWTR
jgi:integrase